jgi:hypothetical protein
MQLHSNNKACTRLGVRTAFFGIFLALAESRFEGESTLPPQAGTDYCSCQVPRKLHLFKSFSVTPDRKQNLPIEIKLSWQIFSFFRMILFIFRECFAIPVSLSFVPGFSNSFVCRSK